MKIFWENIFWVLFPHEDVMQTQFKKGLILPKTPITYFELFFWLYVQIQLLPPGALMSWRFPWLFPSFFLGDQYWVWGMSLPHVFYPGVEFSTILDIQIFMRTHWSTCSLHKVKLDSIEKADAEYLNVNIVCHPLPLSTQLEIPGSHLPIYYDSWAYFALQD